MSWLSDFIGEGIPKLIRSVPVEVVMSSNINQGQPFLFGNPNSLLRDKDIRVYAIETFVASQQIVGQSGNAVIPEGAAPYITISIHDTTMGNDVIKINGNPYYDFVAAFNTGYPRMCEPFHINLDTSTINLVGNSTTSPSGVLPSPPYSALFNFWYFGQADVIEYLKECGAAQADITAITTEMFGK